MQRVKLLFVAMALIALASCQKLNHPMQPAPREVVSMAEDDNAAAQAQKEAVHAKIHQLLAARQARRQANSKAASNLLASSGSITVPDDFPTIQDAVDNAAPGTKIKVKAGTYPEDVCVDVAGVRITAEGAATLVGGFIVAANNVEIDHFKIDLSQIIHDGIHLEAVCGAKIHHNTIIDASDGICLEGSTNCVIKSNTCTGAIDGIDLNDANGNTIDENTCTGNSDRGIELDDCDNNKVSGNNCSENNDGIKLRNDCDGNELKDNICNDSDDSGIELGGAAIGVFLSGNIIGPGNVANGNADNGVDLFESASNNVVKKNTALNNGICDIVNSGINNVFTKNTAGCTSGL